MKAFIKRVGTMEFVIPFSCAVCVEFDHNQANRDRLVIVTSEGRYAISSETAEDQYFDFLGWLGQ